MLMSCQWVKIPEDRVKVPVQELKVALSQQTVTTVMESMEEDTQNKCLKSFKVNTNTLNFTVRHTARQSVKDIEYWW